MSQLSITPAQAAVLAVADSGLDQAFANGVADGVSYTLAPLLGYSPAPAEYKPLARAVFSAFMAAMMKALNLSGAATGYTGSVFLKGTVTNGSLTVVNGVITAYSAPT